MLFEQEGTRGSPIRPAVAQSRRECEEKSFGIVLIVKACGERDTDMQRSLVNFSWSVCAMR